ncbi:hypothetical protein PMI08_01569 [Brevibacillus sp. CF112]|uniref:putative phage tail protein n=1 Tax=Brevibacillus TaxID=55080 RepID=UPI000271CC2E|nr:putative phage tail protein [Brevibacillus sp. CF112]EJL45684.1 hypothetical protein PMI08_01569 [Brevibacillus sp. CF112]
MTKEERLASMVASVPEYYHESEIFLAIQDAWATDLQKVEDDQVSLVNQFYIQLVDWAIDLWENDYAVTPLATDDLETRRARVLAKIQGLGTFTKHAALGLANVYSRAKTAKYISIPGRYAFKTQHDIDDLVDLASLISSFEVMKPAHLRHIVGLLIRQAMAPGYKTRFHFTLTHKDQWMKPKTGLRLNVTGEAPHFSKYDAPFVNGVKNTPPTLYMNGAWDANGYYKMDGQNPDGVKLYTRQTETLTITKRSKATGEVLGRWVEVDRPK